MTHLAPIAYVQARNPVRCLSLEEMLVWAYRTQRVDYMTGRTLHGLEAMADDPYLEPRGSSADGVAKMERIGALGVRIDESGGCFGASAECDPDAEMLHDILLQLGREGEVGQRPWMMAAIIMQFARDGERPARCAVPIPKPTPPDAGTPPDRRRWYKAPGGRRINYCVKATERSIVWTKPKGNRRYQAPEREVFEHEFCPLSWEPYDPTWYDAVNSIFDRWAHAMNTLYDRIAGVSFRHHVVTSLFREGDDGY
jgi:hypothetical protein